MIGQERKVQVGGILNGSEIMKDINLHWTELRKVPPAESNHQNKILTIPDRRFDPVLMFIFDNTSYSFWPNTLSNKNHQNRMFTFENAI